MIVFGGGEWQESTAELLRRIGGLLAEAAAEKGLRRHAALVDALIEAGCLAQGVADHGFAARGDLDDVDPAAEAALRLAARLAEAVARSWDSGFTEWLPDSSAISAAIRAASGASFPCVVALREPEGFAHYAVYPEAFMLAARDLPPGPVCIVGIRSIGTTLAAAVAARCPGVSGLMTLRPVGHPFRREVRVSAALRALIQARAGDRFAVVDEGPGLSGSSIGAVLRLLRELRVAPGRIHVLSSHHGEPGAQADAETRALWAGATRHARTFDYLTGSHADPPHRMTTWCADVVGAVQGPPAEISAGAWRDRREWPSATPPVHPWQERRKVLLRSTSGTWIARYAGLGRSGRQKLALARHLAGAGFGAEPAGLAHGFLLERWHENARPLELRSRRAPFLERLGAYLALRAALAAPPGRSGASVPALFDMLLVNAGEALGAAAASAAESWRLRLEALEERRRPVLTDNRLQAWEWFEIGERILKADALDHHAGHDIVGAQDIAWDVAGAVIEFALTPDERDRLVRLVEDGGSVGVDQELAAFMGAAYAAFWLGYYRMAAAAADPGERAHHDAAARRYRDALAERLM